MRPDDHMYRSALDSRKSARRNRFATMASVLAAVVLVVLAACGESGTGPDTEVATVSVAPAVRTLVVGDEATLEATVKNRGGDPLEGREIEWTSSSPTVAEVSQTGQVEALQEGTATISATSEGKSGTARIIVTAAPPPPPVEVARVEIEPIELVLPKYESRQLGARAFDALGEELEGRAVTWSIEDTDVGSIDATGRVTARLPGWTRVFATIGGKSASMELSVSPAPVAHIILATAGTELDRGESRRIAVRLEDAHGLDLGDRPVTWSSSDPDAVVVSYDGLAYGQGEGTATITATSEGKSASVALRVVPAPVIDLIYDRPTAAGGAEIFLLELGYPSLPVRLNAGNVSRDPSPSPDGERYVFAVSQRDFTTGAPQNDLFVVNVNGLAIRRLTSMPGVEQEPAWSPDGTRIAFSGTDENGRTDIWVVNADGTTLVNLTSGMGEFVAEHAPAWSPDGSSIAFATTVDGILGPVWTMRADGSGRARLASDVGHGVNPTWSPDGTRIAFHYFSGLATGTDIAVVPAAGGVATRLPIAGDERSPAWSPDGALIAFTALDAHGVQQLWTMRPDGTGARARTTSGGRNAGWIPR